jgi:hypothetical protein
MPYAQLSELLVREYGVAIGGRNLRKVLGFESATAFGRAVRAGHVGVRLFQMPGRRGRFALAQELAIWLEHQAKSKNPSVDASPTKENTEDSKM